MFTNPEGQIRNKIEKNSAKLPMAWADPLKRNLRADTAQARKIATVAKLLHHNIYECNHVGSSNFCNPKLNQYKSTAQGDTSANMPLPYRTHLQYRITREQTSTEICFCAVSIYCMLSVLSLAKPKITTTTTLK